MSPPDEPAPARPVLVPVIIAAVFLTIIGASIGLALGARSQNRLAASAPPSAPPATSRTTAAAPAPSAEPSAAPSRVPSAEPSAKPSAEASGRPCRPETQRAAAEAGAAGGLTEVVHRVYARSDVWICADRRDRLYYHANRGGPGDRWADGETALFLAGVQRRGDDYVARNQLEAGTVVFEVTPTQLRIMHPGAEAEIQPLVRG